jgi:hypothetical protein
LIVDEIANDKRRIGDQRADGFRIAGSGLLACVSVAWRLIPTMLAWRFGSSLQTANPFALLFGGH